MINRAEYLAACGQLQASAELQAKTMAVIVTDLLNEIDRLKGFEALYNEACAKLAAKEPTT